MEKLKSLVFNYTNKPVYIREKNITILPNKAPYELEHEIALRYRNSLVIVSYEFLKHLKPVEDRIRQLLGYKKEAENRREQEYFFQSNFLSSNLSRNRFKKVDFLYSFCFKEIEEPVQRLIKSIESIRKQNVRICVCNTSKECILPYIKHFEEISYIHTPLDIQEYNKSMTINLGVREMISGEYFFVSDIDLIYPPNFIKNMMKYTLLKNPVRVYFYTHNLADEFENCSYQYLKKRLKYSKDKKRGHFQPAVGNGLIHKESFDRINGFDERFWGFGLEDTDFNIRISYINDLVTLNDELVNTIHLFHRHGRKEKTFNKNKQILNQRKKLLEKINRKKFDLGRHISLIKGERLI